MYNLTIHFGPNAVAWSFLFKNSPAGEDAYKRACEAQRNNVPVKIEDDYGQHASISGINGVLLEDTELGNEARILRGLDNARGQARANERAKTDPELRRLNTQGPNVLTPFANGGFRQ